MCFEFLHNFCPKFFLILRTIHRNTFIIRNVHRPSRKVSGYSCQILMELEFYQQIFKKNIQNIKFHYNLSSGSRVVPCGRTDRHDEVNSRFSQFCECALKKSLFVLQTDLHDWRKPNPTTDKTLPTGQTKR